MCEHRIKSQQKPLQKEPPTMETWINGGWEVEQGWFCGKVSPPPCSSVFVYWYGANSVAESLVPQPEANQ